MGADNGVADVIPAELTHIRGHRCALNTPKERRLRSQNAGRAPKHVGERSVGVLEARSRSDRRQHEVRSRAEARLLTEVS